MVTIYLASALVAFLLSFGFCKLLIPILQRLKAGQNILSYVKEHKEKSGTPTMGGIAFITAAVISAAVFIGAAKPTLLRTSVLSIVIGLLYMGVGLWDDFLKLRHKENLGLRAWQKFLFQAIIAFFCGIYAFRAGLTRLQIPFFQRAIDVGLWVIPLTIFVFLATVNGVNLTDGLDGLAAGVSVPFFAVIGVFISLQNADRGLAVMAFSLVGALLAYLLFNAPPAKVFMGDTGSLSLGGFVSALCCFTGNALYIPLIGICFVFSVISVILQVIYYKVTGGKRIFLMAPLHHHFQEKGFSESHISYAYFTITLLMGIICLLGFF